MTHRHNRTQSDLSAISEKLNTSNPTETKDSDILDLNSEIYQRMLEYATDENLLGMVLTENFQSEIFTFVQNRMEFQELYDEMRSDYDTIVDEVDNFFVKNNLGLQKEEFEKKKSLPKSQIIRMVFNTAGKKITGINTDELQLYKGENEELERLLEQIKNNERYLKDENENLTIRLNQSLKDADTKNTYFQKLEENNKNLVNDLNIKKQELIKLECKSQELEKRLNENSLKNQKDIRTIRNQNQKVTSELKSVGKDTHIQIQALETTNKQLETKVEELKKDVDIYDRNSQLALQEIEKRDFEIANKDSEINLLKNDIEGIKAIHTEEKSNLEKKIESLNSKIMAKTPCSPTKLNNNLELSKIGESLGQTFNQEQTMTDLKLFEENIGKGESQKFNNQESFRSMNNSFNDSDSRIGRILRSSSAGSGTNKHSQDTNEILDNNSGKLRVDITSKKHRVKSTYDISKTKKKSKNDQEILYKEPEILIENLNTFTILLEKNTQELSIENIDTIYLEKDKQELLIENIDAIYLEKEKQELSIENINTIYLEKHNHKNEEIISPQFNLFTSIVLSNEKHAETIHLALSEFQIILFSENNKSNKESESLQISKNVFQKIIFPHQNPKKSLKEEEEQSLSLNLFQKIILGSKKPETNESEQLTLCKYVFSKMVLPVASKKQDKLSLAKSVFQYSKKKPLKKNELSLNQSPYSNICVLPQKSKKIFPQDISTNLFTDVFIAQKIVNQDFLNLSLSVFQKVIDLRSTRNNNDLLSLCYTPFQVSIKPTEKKLDELQNESLGTQVIIEGVGKQVITESQIWDNLPQTKNGDNLSFDAKVENSDTHNENQNSTNQKLSIAQYEFEINTFPENSNKMQDFNSNINMHISNAQSPVKLHSKGIINTQTSNAQSPVKLQSMGGEDRYISTRFTNNVERSTQTYQHHLKRLKNLNCSVGTNTDLTNEELEEKFDKKMNNISSIKRRHVCVMTNVSSEDYDHAQGYNKLLKKTHNIEMEQAKKQTNKEIGKYGNSLSPDINLAKAYATENQYYSRSPEVSNKINSKYTTQAKQGVISEKKIRPGNAVTKLNLNFCKTEVSDGKGGSIRSIPKSSSYETENINKICMPILEDPELKKYLTDLEKLTARTNNDTVRKNSGCIEKDKIKDDKFMNSGIYEKFCKIINGLKRDIMIVEDKEKKIRLKYEKVQKNYAEIKAERDSFKDSLFEKEK